MSGKPGKIGDEIKVGGTSEKLGEEAVGKIESEPGRLGEEAMEEKLAAVPAGSVISQ